MKIVKCLISYSSVSGRPLPTSCFCDLEQRSGILSPSVKSARNSQLCNTAEQPSTRGRPQPPLFSMVTTELYPTQNHVCTALMPALSGDAWFLLASSCGFGPQGTEFLSYLAAGSKLPSQTARGRGKLCGEAQEIISLPSPKARVHY